MNSNLKRRNIPFSPPDMTEAEADEVRDAILSGWITTGPRTKKLESLLAEYVGVAKCVCMNSQTACAEMALRLLGVGEGDEVIVPAYTYTASASVVYHVGAKVVFVDNQPDCLEMDYEAVEAAISPRTKAIIPVDLGGIPCDYERLLDIVERKRGVFNPTTELQRMMGRVAICADCAHALGSWREMDIDGAKQKVMCGAMADFSSFSFHAVKNFTTAEGGALTWNLPFGEDVTEGNETWNQRIYRIAQLLSLHGQNKDALAKTRLGAWEYDIIGPWFKCNMTDIMAAMGLVQFQRYPEMLDKRHNYVERYDEAFRRYNETAKIKVRGMKHYGEHYAGNGHLYITRLEGMNREQVNEVIAKMGDRGIVTNVHYKPLPMMTAYREKGFDIKDFPHAWAAFDNEITLPLNTKMTIEDIDYVIENLIDVLRN